jgi:hypothetical protein
MDEVHRPADVKLDVGGVTFTFVASLEPDRGPDGAVVQYMPQAAYRRAKQVPLNRHGGGPFCRFRISANLPNEGVYALTLAGRVVYIGECQNLSERFGPRGYGSIQPRNCFVGGQSTNSKLNHLVLQQALQGHTIELWFHQAGDRKHLEAMLLAKARPEWNSHLT